MIVIQRTHRTIMLWCQLLKQMVHTVRSSPMVDFFGPIIYYLVLPHYYSMHWMTLQPSSSLAINFLKVTDCCSSYASYVLSGICSQQVGVGVTESHGRQAFEVTKLNCLGYLQRGGASGGLIASPVMCVNSDPMHYCKGSGSPCSRVALMSNWY